MPGNNALPSYIGNMTAMRDKMSAVRQRLSLEAGPRTQSNMMKPVAPSPPEGADMDKKGAAIKTMEEGPSMEDLEALMSRPIQEHPNYMAMRTAAQRFIDENQNGIDDRQEGTVTSLESIRQAPQPNDPAGQGAATGSLVNDPKMIQALAPLSEFFKQNGRLPSQEELKDIAAKKQAMAVLGREPTPEEVALYRQTPPKEVKADEPSV